jgi:hypothetical protein
MGMMMDEHECLHELNISNSGEVVNILLNFRSGGIKDSEFSPRTTRNTRTKD